MQKYLDIFLREKKKTNKFATRSHKKSHYIDKRDVESYLFAPRQRRLRKNNHSSQFGFRSLASGKKNTFG
jgi:hypothetical protein